MIWFPVRFADVSVFFDLQGKLYVRGDSKIFRFQNGKSESLFLQRKNPRRIAWTVLYRRQHRKGISEVGYTSSLGLLWDSGWETNGRRGNAWDILGLSPTDQEEDYHLKNASAIYETKC